MSGFKTNSAVTAPTPGEHCAHVSVMSPRQLSESPRPLLHCASFWSVQLPLEILTKLIVEFYAQTRLNNFNGPFLIPILKKKPGQPRADRRVSGRDLRLHHRNESANEITSLLRIHLTLHRIERIGSIANRRNIYTRKFGDPHVCVDETKPVFAPTMYFGNHLPCLLLFSRRRFRLKVAIENFNGLAATFIDISLFDQVSKHQPCWRIVPC